MKVHNLMQAWGFDTTVYLEEMSKVKPQIDAHLATRAVHNRMAFLFYYRALDWAFPWTFEELLLGEFQIGLHEDGTSMNQQRRYFIPTSSCIWRKCRRSAFSQRKTAHT